MSSTIHLLGQDLEYVDGSEDHILTVLRNASDRSAGSDELLAQIIDWPTMYHFSPGRLNLLNPFNFSPQHRVLEIGCGTGVNIRAIAESGAEVVGVEGTKVRAMAARTRCEDLHNVSIYSGDVKNLPNIGLFDAVLLIGVLEYSDSIHGGFGGPDELLQIALKHLKGDGELILAIENQIGLKYLLGYPEDHLGIPWIGIEGYRERRGPRTWSRKQLSSILTRNGLASQRWLYPFPDYKHPKVILSHELLASEHGCSIAKNFVRTPIVDYSASPQFVIDSVSAFRVMVDAGLLPDISNSFLIAASRTDVNSPLIRSDELAWLGHVDRLKKWRTSRTIVDQNTGFIVKTSLDSFPNTSEDWLSNIRIESSNVIDGKPLDDLIQESLNQRDFKQIRKLLECYWKFLEDHVAERHASKLSHQFADSELSRHLPPDFLDCIPQNLISTQNGLVFVDREWVANSPVALSKIWIRGLLSVTLNARDRGALASYPEATSVVGSIRYLSGIIGIEIRDLDIESVVYSDEPDFQSLVAGQSVHKRWIQEIGRIPNSLASQSNHSSSVGNPKVGQPTQVDHAVLLNGKIQELLTDRQLLVEKVALLSQTTENLRIALQRTRKSVSYRIGNCLVRPIYALLSRFLSGRNL